MGRGCCSRLCSARSLFILVLIISAVPLAYLVSLELSSSATHVYLYRSLGWFRECAKWDHHHRRFLLSSFSGGISAVHVSDDHDSALEEVPLVVVGGGEDLAGNASLGLVIDRPRNRLVVVIADVMGNKFSGLIAYDLSTWHTLFFTPLPTTHNSEKSFADDVAVDTEGNAYVTDGKGNKIWKVGPGGEFLSVIDSPLFKEKEWYKNLMGLNGIVHHPDGFLLVIHTFSGKLFRIQLGDGEDNNGGAEPTVEVVQVVGGPLRFGDGLELVSPTELVVAGMNPSARLVESKDRWQTAKVVGSFNGPRHRLASAATVKDGKVYINHIIGFGFPNMKHALVQAVF